MFTAIAPILLGMFTKLQMVPISFAMSMQMEQLSSHWAGFD
jgi:hypothetical protein